MGLVVRLSYDVGNSSIVKGWNVGGSCVYDTAGAVYPLKTVGFVWSVAVIIGVSWGVCGDWDVAGMLNKHMMRVQVRMSDNLHFIIFIFEYVPFHLFLDVG